MIPAQELTIGNWVYESGRTQFPMYIRSMGEDWVNLDFNENEGDLWESDLSDIEPIPLSEKLLIHIGFLKLEDGRFVLKYGDQWCYVRFSETTTTFEAIGSMVIVKGVMNLHTLQNLYFTITGEHLLVGSI